MQHSAQSAPASASPDTPADADVPAAASGRLGFRRKVKAYVALTKPRVIELLLVTTAPVMIDRFSNHDLVESGAAKYVDESRTETDWVAPDSGDLRRELLTGIPLDTGI